MIFFVGSFSLKAHADDLSTEIINKQSELKGLWDSANLHQDFTHQEWEQRNPFLVHVSKEDMETSNFTLEGIFLGTSKPSAIINGTVVAEGDQVEDAEVLEINDNNVVLKDGQGIKQVLEIKKSHAQDN